jgi:hypothetical protein
MLAEVKRGHFLAIDEANFLYFTITNKCGKDVGDLDYNQLGAKVDLDFWLS